VSKTQCAEVFSASGVAPNVKLLLIAERVEGFFVGRFTEGGELVSETQHETMDEAMREIYSDYDAVSEWRECPDGVDPLEYIRERSSRSIDPSRGSREIG
jgi:hypothetical protein